MTQTDHLHRTYQTLNPQTGIQSGMSQSGLSLYQSGGESRCPACGDWYERLGMHWQYHPAHRPELTKRQREITTGLMLGDGNASANKNSAYPRIQCNTITRPFLRWLDSEMGVLGTGISLHQSAEKSAENARSNGLDPAARDENYSDVWRWRTRAHPEFERYVDWYADDGTKQLAPDTNLTPLVLKLWYCGDGNIKSLQYSDCFELSTTAPASEGTREGVLTEMFSEIGVTPTFNKNGKNVYFSPDHSRALWDYIGEPLPGFEYKWPNRGEER